MEKFPKTVVISTFAITISFVLLSLFSLSSAIQLLMGFCILMFFNLGLLIGYALYRINLNK